MKTNLSRRHFLGCSAGATAGLLSALPYWRALGLAGGAAAAADPVRIKLLFLAKPVPTWPTPHLDVQEEMARLRRTLDELAPQMPDIQFEGGELLRTAEHVPGVGDSVKAADGVLVFNLTSTVGHMVRAVAEFGRPTVLFSQPYSGHDWSIIADMQAAGLKIEVVASSDYADIVPAMRPLRAVKRLAQSKLLVLRTAKQDETPATSRFGVQILPLQEADLARAYEAAAGPEAEAEARRWIENAERVVEPSREEIVRSARMYLAMRQVLDAAGAQAIAINCLGMFREGKLPAYPCLGFARLNDLGMVGACEADVDSSLTMLMFAYLAGKPGFISDPVIDTATNTVIHAHCVAPVRMDGPDGPAAPYLIRSHMEDDKGAALQVKMRVGQKITMARTVGAESLLLSTGEILDNPDLERGCRTKIATRVADARALLAQYSHGLHRVIFYGDHMLDAERLARYLGIQVIREV